MSSVENIYPAQFWGPAANRHLILHNSLTLRDGFSSILSVVVLKAYGSRNV